MESFNSKILLFGEYTLMHNSMALVVPCDRYSGRLNFYESAQNKEYAIQSNEYLKKFSSFIASNLDENFVLEVKLLEQEIENGLFFQSNIPQGYGLGSSGALVVAIFLRYLKKTKSLKDDLKWLTFKKIEQLKSSLGKMESFFHGVSSGLDPLSIILNEPVLYKNAHDIITTTLPEEKEDGKNVVFLLNTNIARSTSGLMSRFQHLYQTADFRNKLHKELIPQTDSAIQSFLQDDSASLYKDVHGISTFQINEMKDFIPLPLQQTVKNGLEHGDYSLKLCGAGGGGFMLGFTESWDRTSETLKDYDLQVLYRY
ncbi:MAG: hypothetical protein ABI290_11170 [Ginsengibacter sp.]|jgi:mevalonate kinase